MTGTSKKDTLYCFFVLWDHTLPLVKMDVNFKMWYFQAFLKHDGLDIGQCPKTFKSIFKSDNVSFNVSLKGGILTMQTS